MRMIAPRNASVAQLDRVLPSEGRGRGFESRRMRHLEARHCAGFFVSMRPLRLNLCPPELLASEPGNGGKRMDILPLIAIAFVVLFIYSWQRSRSKSHAGKRRRGGLSGQDSNTDFGNSDFGGGGDGGGGGD